MNEQEIREKYKHFVEYYEAEHGRNLQEIEADTGNMGTERERRKDHMKQRIEAENERFAIVMRSHELKIAEIVKHADLPEVEYTSQGFGFTHPEIERMTNEGYEAVSIIDITNPAVKAPQTKLYKFKKKS